MLSAASRGNHSPKNKAENEHSATEDVTLDPLCKALFQPIETD